MPDSIPSSGSLPLLPSWRRPVSVLVVVGILAFALWTLPNWVEFWNNVSQFPSLWQLPANREIIISLVIKIISPLLLMGIAAIMIWITSLMKGSQRVAATERVRFENVLQKEIAEKNIDQSTSSAIFALSSQMQALPYSTPSCRQPTPLTPGNYSDTPLPPMVSEAEALSNRLEKAKSVTSSSEEQLVSIVDQQGERNSLAGTAAGVASLQISNTPHLGALTSESGASSQPVISLRLLKDVSMLINVPGGGSVVVPLTLNAKRVQLLAYIAWRRGELIDRDKILEHVFGWGLSDEEATEDKLSERFESHKKLLRKKIREVVLEHVNTPAGRPLIDPELDPFVSDSGFWGLSERCRVEDLEAIETHHTVIALARKDGKLVDEIPEYVKDACDQLIAQYAGDFLESLMRKYPGEFRSWQGRSSWTRKPYTRYRDYYLDALWYAAEYEWRMGQRYADQGSVELGEEDLRKQQEHFSRAAQQYQRYALYACNSRFDAKVTFGVHGEMGERVGMSERALRRCVVLLGAIGRTDLVNQVWSAYSTQMKSISDQRWQPSKETQADVEAAKAQTSAYRFAAQISQMSSEFAERADHIS